MTKRTLLSTCASLLIASVMSAQDHTDFNLKMRAADGVQPTSSVNDGRPDSDGMFGRAAGDTVWYDGFANLDNWTLGTTGAFGTADSLWERTTTGPYGTFSGTWGDIQSSTVGNGWVMFDSDGNGSANPTTGAPTGVEFDTYIQMTDPVDLSSYPVVAVTFVEYYKELNSEVFLDVSTDGTNWTSFQLHVGFGANDATDQDAVQYRDISALAGGQASVWVRLRYVGYGYFWQVDDFAIVEGIENDIQLTRVFTGNNLNDYLYTKTPLSQAVDLELGVVATNAGGVAQTNVSVDWEISDGSSVVASGTEAIAATIAPGDSDTIFFGTSYTPTTVGEYTITMTVTSDESDSNPANNQDSDVIEITDFVWAHDYSNKPYFGWGYAATSTEGADGYEMGANYLCRVNGDFIYALQFPLGNNTTALSVTAKVYEDDPNNGPVSETIYDIQTGDLSSVSNPKFITIVLDDPVEMLEGSVYTATVAIEASDEGYILGNQFDDNDGGQSVFFESDGLWYNWIGLTTAMRLNLDPAIGIEENQDVSGVYIFPNPTSDMLNIGFVSKEDQNMTINIIAMDGSLILTEQRSAKVGQSNLVTFDTSKLAAGMYMVQLAGANSFLTQRVVVQ